MFTHIVLWKLQDHAQGKSKIENARLIKERLEEIANMLDGVVRFEVGLNIIDGAEAADVALFSDFDTRADFEAYVAHPAHQALVGFIKDVRSERRVIDYEH